jgi:lysophospholipase L1-like esterase
MNDLELVVELFRNDNLEDEKHKIKVILLSENNQGGIGIKSINAYICGSQKAIEPVKKKKLNIEFIGDSITCAYGVEGKDQNENYKTTTQNAVKSYAYLASQILDADYSIVCYSGSGITSGYTSTGVKSPNNLMPNDYKKISRNARYPDQDWDFEGHRYDVVFINLGTNDNNYVKADPDTRSDEFIQEYVNFLSMVRENNPNSYIICTLGTMGCDATLNLVDKAVKLFGDSKVSFFQSPRQDMNKDGIGSDWHPNAVTHEKLSKIVAEKISEVIG